MTPELLKPEIRRRAVLIAGRFVGLDDAEDMVQKAYLSAFMTCHPFRGNSTAFTWFHRIVVNQCLMHLRRTSRLKEQTVEVMPEVVGDDIPADLRIQHEEHRRAILSAIATLRPKQKRALLAVYFTYPDLAVTRIAKIHGVKLSAFKANLRRGHLALAHILTPQ